MAIAHADEMAGIVVMSTLQDPYHTEASQYNVVDSVDGPVMTAKLSGIIGVILSSMLFLVASWRLIHHFSAMWRRDTDEEVNSTQGITTKRTLHIFLWMTMLIEGGAYSAMVAHDATSKVNYMLLDIIGRGILEYWTFVFGTIYWFNIIAKASRSKGVSARSIYPVVLAVVTVVVTVSGTLEAVSLSRSLYSSVDDFRANSLMHRISLLVGSVCWFVHAVVVTLCGKMVYQKISNLPTLSQVRSTAKRNIINKVSTSAGNNEFLLFVHPFSYFHDLDDNTHGVLWNFLLPSKCMDGRRLRIANNKPGVDIRGGSGLLGWRGVGFHLPA